MRFDAFSDDELLEATSRGPAAFGVFYQRHEDAVLRWCLRRTGDAELAADLAAEVFAAALVSSRRFRVGGPPAEAWLLRPRAGFEPQRSLVRASASSAPSSGPASTSRAAPCWCASPFQPGRRRTRRAGASATSHLAPARSKRSSAKPRAPASPAPTTTSSAAASASASTTPRYASATRPPVPPPGLRPIKLHGLRHAAGSLLARHGTSVEVRDFMGHAKLTTTDSRPNRVPAAGCRTETPVGRVTVILPMTGVLSS